ncbi:MAG TPA: ABC transporter permease [Kofleriaceae bacterium]|nr:ABC transporter permease [Kofleriaceae bacterium]
MNVHSDPERESRVLRGWADLVIGLVLIAACSFVLGLLPGPEGKPAISITMIVLLVVGALTAARGVYRLIRAPRISVPFATGGGDEAGTQRGGLGYKSFVAWRYLLDSRRHVTWRTKLLLTVGALFIAVVSLGMQSDPATTGKVSPMWIAQLVALGFVAVVLFTGVLRFSKPARITAALGLGIFAIAYAMILIWGPDPHHPIEMMSENRQWFLLAVFWIRNVGGGLAGLAMFFGSLRAFFTFFTTVPIGGVWIGTSALVMVLAVMSGFETDLREKILGSNAHLQITREDGDFVGWREMKDKIDRMPGVVASTPYAVSEVVVAANNTGMNVVIKGIDPKTVGMVTDLVHDLEDRKAMQRLEPLVNDAHDLKVPQAPRTGTIVDPPPPDMPTPGDPIDYSVPATDPPPSDAGSDEGSAAHADKPDKPDKPDNQKPRDSEYLVKREPAGSGSDAGSSTAVVDGEKIPTDEKSLDTLAKELDQPRKAIDPPPADLVTSDKPPTDFSQPAVEPPGGAGSGAGSDGDVIKVVDVPFDAPSLSRRTQSLPGVLVGRELVKQTHMYTGEEVRVVSPLSDPSNPDATGTPIPFNRDYRVAGVFYTGMYEYDLKYVYVTLDSLQDFLDRGDAVDGIEVRVTNPDDTAGFIAQFQATFGPGYRVQDWKELNRSLFSALKLEKIAMFLVLGIVILVASFSIVGNLIMVVVEKQREIALLKTLGASDIGVMQLFAIQGLMIGLIGTALGIGTGLLGCWAGKRFGLPLNPDVYYIDKLPIHVDPLSVVAAASAGVLISIAATLYPAMIAARVRPAAGMRH